MCSCIEHLMRRLIKRAAMWLYCRDLIPARLVAWLFQRFKLHAE